MDTASRSRYQVNRHPSGSSSVLTERSDEFEWLWNLSEWQVAESVLNWCFRELQELLFWHDAVSIKMVRDKRDRVCTYSPGPPSLGLRLFSTEKVLAWFMSNWLTLALYLRWNLGWDNCQVLWPMDLPTFCMRVKVLETFDNIAIKLFYNEKTIYHCAISNLYVINYLCWQCESKSISVCLYYE